VRAWHLTEGDQALDGETVVALYRDAPRHTVTVAWSSGERVDLDGSRVVLLARQAVPARRRAMALRGRQAPPEPLPPLTPQERCAARRQLDEWRRERHLP
jgi:hypothetical protein